MVGPVTRGEQDGRGPDGRGPGASRAGWWRPRGRRAALGAVVGVVTAGVLGALMLPLRSHLSGASVALVLIVPVIVGVMVGGFPAGVASVVGGFLVYDLGFIEPYGKLTVDAHQEWVVLAIYVVVLVPVARVVDRLAEARAEAEARADETRRLAELSQRLVEGGSVDALLREVVDAVADVFAIDGVAVLVPGEDGLRLAASVGRPPTGAQLATLAPTSDVPASVGTAPGDAAAMHALRTVALSASGRPVGILLLQDVPASDADRAMLRTFANQAALAVERAQLREQAVQAELLAEVDRLRHALVGAVSHDLRTPLATLKVAASTLADPALDLAPEDRRELATLVESETDRLTRLVTSLLDLTRFEAGGAELQREPVPVRRLVDDAVHAAAPVLGGRPVEVRVADGLPAVDVDAVLVGQVLANLLDNAVRHGPPDRPVVVEAVPAAPRDGGAAAVSCAVVDEGPGVPPAERDAVFDRFVRFDTGGRAGLGLTIAKAFVEAHGGRIWVEDAPGGGARFCFTLPAVGGPAAPPVAGGVAARRGRTGGS